MPNLMAKIRDVLRHLWQSFSGATLCLRPQARYTGDRRSGRRLTYHVGPVRSCDPSTISSNHYNLTILLRRRPFNLTQHFFAERDGRFPFVATFRRT